MTLDTAIIIVEKWLPVYVKENIEKYGELVNFSIEPEYDEDYLVCDVYIACDKEWDKHAVSQVHEALNRIRLEFGIKQKAISQLHFQQGE